MSKKNRKTSGGIPGGNGLKPLKLDELQEKIKPRPALKSGVGQTIYFDLMVAAARPPDVTFGKPTGLDAHAIRYKGQVPAEDQGAKGFEINIAVKSTEFGTRVFRPPVKGTFVELGEFTQAMADEARKGLPSLDGFLPDHLPLHPIPTPLEEELKVRRFYEKLPEDSPEDVHEATTLFPPEDRYTFSDTSFPWCTVGRVDTAGGYGSGVLIGPRHLLTASHIMVWNSDGTSGWIRFRPSYFDGNTPFGEAWGTHWYAYKKVVGPSIDRSEGRQDYVVVVLNRRMGDMCGWMGSRTYSDSWDGGNYWSHIGYPGDLAAGQRPSYEGSISLDGSFWDRDTHQRIWHRADVWPGQSGGPFFGWWSGEPWPRTVSVQSGQRSSENSASGGSRMVNLIIQALNDFP